MTNKTSQKVLPIETPNELFGSYLYPGAKQIMEDQQDVFWTAQEIPIEKDIPDYRNNMSEEQFNLVSATLQDFVEIEQDVGEIWETIATWYPHSEIQAACAQISSMEKSVHAFFYQKMSDELNIDPEVTAENQQNITSIRDKLAYIKYIMTNLADNKPLTLFTVAMIEQVLLFGNFATLKSFKSNGYNLINNTLTGVDFVIQDEQLHGEYAKYLFSVSMIEGATRPSIEDITQVVESIIQYEDASIDYKFPGKLPINGITGEQLKTFTRSRANTVLEDMGFASHYTITDNPIADWFYRGSKSIKSHDFFNSGTNQYRRNWKVNNFSRLPHIKGAINE